MTADEINGIDRVEQLMAADADEYGSPFQSFVPAPSSALPTGGVLATTATKDPHNSAAAGCQTPPIPSASFPGNRRRAEHQDLAPQSAGGSTLAALGLGASLPAHARGSSGVAEHRAGTR